MLTFCNSMIKKFIKHQILFLNNWLTEHFWQNSTEKVVNFHTKKLELLIQKLEQNMQGSFDLETFTCLIQRYISTNKSETVLIKAFRQRVVCHMTMPGPNKSLSPRIVSHIYFHLQSRT